MLSYTQAPSSNLEHGLLVFFLRVSATMSEIKLPYVIFTQRRYNTLCTLIVAKKRRTMTWTLVARRYIAQVLKLDLAVPCCACWDKVHNM